MTKHYENFQITLIKTGTDALGKELFLPALETPEREIVWQGTHPERYDLACNTAAAENVRRCKFHELMNKAVLRGMEVSA